MPKPTIESFERPVYIVTNESGNHFAECVTKADAERLVAMFELARIAEEFLVSEAAKITGLDMTPLREALEATKPKASGVESDVPF